MVKKLKRRRKHRHHRDGSSVVKSSLKSRNVGSRVFDKGAGRAKRRKPPSAKRTKTGSVKMVRVQIVDYREREANKPCEILKIFFFCIGICCAAYAIAIGAMNQKEEDCAFDAPDVLIGWGIVYMLINLFSIWESIIILAKGSVKQLACVMLMGVLLQLAMLGILIWGSVAVLGISTKSLSFACKNISLHFFHFSKFPGLDLRRQKRRKLL